MPAKFRGLCNGCGHLRGLRRYEIENGIAFLCDACKKRCEDEAEKKAYREGGEQ